MRLKNLLKDKGINQKDLAEKTNLSEPMISKFRNYVCLPVPEDMEKLCMALGCDVLDLYDKDEIQFLKQKRRKSSELKYYKLTVRINKNFKWLFEEDTLRSLGYHSLYHMISALVIDKLIIKINEQKKQKMIAEKKVLDAGTPNTQIVS